MRTISQRFVMLSAGAALMLLASCANFPPPDSKIPIAQERPSVVNLVAGKHGDVFVNLTLDEGEKRLFLLDTGSPDTALDRTLEPKLGKPLGREEYSMEYEPKARINNYYQAPALYLNNTRLMTGPRVFTEDLRRPWPDEPVMGILGMDCLRHYCFQLDFKIGTMRFLDPESPQMVEPEKAGRTYTIDFLSSGHPAIHQQFAGGETTDWVIDTGCPSDGQLTPKQFAAALKANTVTEYRKLETPLGVPMQVATFKEIQFGGEPYDGAILNEGRHQLLGIRFLARHDVTLNFPMKTMRLVKREQGAK